MTTMGSGQDGSFDLPKLRVSFIFEHDTQYLSSGDAGAEFFDVKFCPYQPPDHDPVFAAVSKKHVVICRLSSAVPPDTNPCEVLTVIRDNDEDSSACCCTWSEDPVTGNPLICIGGVDAKVKVYDPVSKELFACFAGHGGDVNDLATSPSDPSVIASASGDFTVRLWSLSPVHKKQPCICILGGDSHLGDLLSVAFHDTGRYLLSAGHDQVVNLWTLPDLPQESLTTPLQMHYPHFSTSEIHSGIIDCVAFYDDLILSRACHENVIVLWRIEGFSSADPPPDLSMTPGPSNAISTTDGLAGVTGLTQSAFVPTPSLQCPSMFTRIAEFHTPNCGPLFFMRFKLHFKEGHNPVMAFCNAGGNIFFWDFQRLAVYQKVIEKIRDPRRDKSTPVRLPGWLKPVTHRARTDALGRVKAVPSDKDSVGSGQTGHSEGSAKNKDGVAEFSAETLESWAARYSLDDSREPLKAHKTESSSANFVGRQVAWSPGGEWCVVVGSSNTGLVLQRWAKKNPGPGNSKAS